MGVKQPIFLTFKDDTYPINIRRRATTTTTRGVCYCVSGQKIYKNKYLSIFLFLRMQKML